MLAPAVAASLLLLGRLYVAGAAANISRGRPSSTTRRLIQLQPDIIGPESVNITSGVSFLLLDDKLARTRVQKRALPQALALEEPVI